MPTLKKQYEQLKQWDYYKRESSDTVRKIDDWDNTDEHKKFIEEFLKISGKETVKDIFEKINNTNLEDFERLDHINSVFFIGCLFYENTILKESIDFHRKDDTNKERDEFYFIWFLTSLVHDFGYKIENNIPSEVDNNIDSLKKYINDKAGGEYYNLLDEIHNYNVSSNMQTLLKNLPSYYTARMDGKISRGTQPKIDHGIVAGLILFNSLKYIRIKKLEELKSFAIDGCIDEKINLYWCDDLDEFYFIASSSIAVHNMRRAKKCTCQERTYLEYGMNDLILEAGDIKRLSVKDDPFLFLFSLVDSIEPTKNGKLYNKQKILEDFFIKFINSYTIEISVSDDSGLSLSNLKDLESWLDVEINGCSDKSKIIIIKE